MCCSLPFGNADIADETGKYTFQRFAMAENEDGERLYWGNRIMESSILDLNELDVLANKPLISVLSYNVLRQSMCMPPRYPNCQKQHLRWLYRRDRLMEEITTYDADIVCLQVSFLVYQVFKIV